MPHLKKLTIRAAIVLSCFAITMGSCSKNKQPKVPAPAKTKFDSVYKMAGSRLWHRRYISTQPWADTSYYLADTMMAIEVVDTYTVRFNGFLLEYDHNDYQAWPITFVNNDIRFFYPGYQHLPRIQYYAGGDSIKYYFQEPGKSWIKAISMWTP
jgi:hypothetical protein